MNIFGFIFKLLFLTGIVFGLAHTLDGSSVAESPAMQQQSAVTFAGLYGKRLETFKRLTAELD